MAQSAMSSSICCICAQDLQSSCSPLFNPVTEKETLPVELSCCQRTICPSCSLEYPRFRQYCPYCPQSDNLKQQDSSKNQDWHKSAAVRRDTGPAVHEAPPHEKTDSTQDVLHFVDPSMDSIKTLAIRYGVPADALRRTNALFSDHLLAARKTILIPGEFYKGGVSLSPQPKDGEEEEIRKGKIRRFQIASKCSDYSTALLYLDQTAYDVDLAVETFLLDEAWEKANPLCKGKHRKTVGLGSFSRQKGII